ncbi:A24 family peptidase [Tannockella kyphosi]|uniref:A24 family peptidase n=1 Tax=Tannockella kyphosi TaxID=2899121 RepID=UPI002013282D|nr:A24 family peptidase [Tannockella kyphosi]
MLLKIKRKLKDINGGISVPVIFPLIALLLVTILHLTFFSIGNETFLSWNLVKAMLFITILVFASISDLKTMTVSDKYTFMLLGVGLVGVTLDSLVGASICFISFFLVAMLTNLGGADVKIAGACGFVLGALPSLIALLIGLSLSVIVEIAVTLIKREPIKRHYPLVPYITIGCIAVTIMKGINLL